MSPWRPPYSQENRKERILEEVREKDYSKDRGEGERRLVTSLKPMPEGRFTSWIFSFTGAKKLSFSFKPVWIGLQLKKKKIKKKENNSVIIPKVSLAGCNIRRSWISCVFVAFFQCYVKCALISFVTKKKKTSFFFLKVETLPLLWSSCWALCWKPEAWSVWNPPLSCRTCPQVPLPRVSLASVAPPVTQQVWSLREMVQLEAWEASWIQIN